MKKLSGILLFLLLFCSMAWAQSVDQFSVRVVGGKASYSMSDLKGLHYAYNSHLPVRPRITDDFPAYRYYEVQAFYSPVPDWKVGLSYGTTSTGARVTYSDYSGAYYFDQLVQCREFGVVSMYALGKWTAGKWNTFTINSGLSLTAVFSDYEMEERLQVYDHEESAQLSFTAKGAGIKPFLNFSWQFRFIELMADAGYLLNPGKGLLEEGKGLLLNSRGEEVKPDWSGYRLGLGVGINLNGLKKKPSSVNP